MHGAWDVRTAWQLMEPGENHAPIPTRLVVALARQLASHAEAPRVLVCTRGVVATNCAADGAPVLSASCASWGRSRK